MKQNDGNRKLGGTLFKTQPTHILCDSVEGDEHKGVLFTISVGFTSPDYGDHTITLTQFLEQEYNYEQGHFHWVMQDKFGNIVMTYQSRDSSDYKDTIPKKACYNTLDEIYLFAMQYAYFGDIPIMVHD